MPKKEINKNSKKDFEVVEGNSKSLKISQVEDHINIGESQTKKITKKVVIPKGKK